MRPPPSLTTDESEPYTLYEYLGVNSIGINSLDLTGSLLIGETFYDDIRQLSVNSFNYVYGKGFSSNTEGMPVVSLILKPGKDTEYCKNWRPITLSHPDYKICATCIATSVRESPSVRYIISSNQTGFLTGKVCSWENRRRYPGSHSTPS